MASNPNPTSDLTPSDELPTKVLQALGKLLVLWEGPQGREVAASNALRLLKGIRGGSPGDIKVAATQALERGLRSHLGLHLGDGDERELVNLLLELGATMPPTIHVCRDCGWVFEASRPRSLCDRCGKRPQPEAIRTAAYTEIPLPRYRDGQPDGWRIFRIGICHECGRSILPDEMGKSNKEVCGGACGTARSRAGRSKGDWSPQAKEALARFEIATSSLP